jgi:hypothetical protein
MYHRTVKKEIEECSSACLLLSERIHPASYRMGTRDFFIRGKVAEA